MRTDWRKKLLSKASERSINIRREESGLGESKLEYIKKPRSEVEQDFRIIYGYAVFCALLMVGVSFGPLLRVNNPRR